MRLWGSLLAVLALAGCATSLPHVVEREGDTFEVRFDPAMQGAAEADSVARRHCDNGAADYLSQHIGFDGLGYRTYRCALG